MPKQEQKNKWKLRFYLLVGINAAILVTILLLIFWPVSDTTVPSNESQEELESSEFTVRTTKENLNELINAYVGKLLQNTSHEYEISLEEDVHLVGELPVFSTTVPLSVHLEPLVQENGDVVLKQNSISVGLLELPNQKIMEYMQKYLPMPGWVTINPKEEEIYIAVTEMDIRSNFQVEVEHIDLPANNIAIKLKVPYKTLGIDLQKYEQQD
ncbi:YpmS family protein [Oceanobacillus halotolerans]|uniref:YpmS family protein n=1 Tax=Oceanobacillus halotolerans TaxID=2663380 RepID=UPI0013DAE847|nr:YpmS family protein [Oceanobacillus halotolerans]